MNGSSLTKIWILLILVLFLMSGCPRSGPETTGQGSSSTDWPTFQANNARTGAVTGPFIHQPGIWWKTEIGIQGWLNNPIIVHDRVFVGSEGATWNQADSKDGVYCLELATGNILWFTPAENDVNGVAFAHGLIVATGDEGAAWALSADTGKQVWLRKSDREKMYTNPLIQGDLAVVGDSGGFLYGLDLMTGKVRWKAQLQGAIRGGASSDGERIFVGSQGGEVVILGLDGTELFRDTLTYTGYGSGTAEIYAAPTVAGNQVIFGYARDTYYEVPALIAIDRKTAEIKWNASDPKHLHDGFGNLRSSPAVYQDILIWGEPYSNRAVAAQLETGELTWSTPAGFCMFPHWPSPAIVSGQVFLPRHDGWLDSFNAQDGMLLWSLYLGDAKLAGSNQVSTPPCWPDCKDCEWAPDKASIYSSPAAASSVLVVGTSEGFLFGIGERK